MDKAITTAFMIIVSVVCAVLVFNAVYPAIIQSSHAMVSMKSRVDDRLKSQIAIIHATGSVADDKAYVWVKNVGSLRIRPIERCDVFFGPEGDFDYIPHEGDDPNPDCLGCYWTYKVVGNDSEWNPTATSQITVTYESSLSSGIFYFVKVVIPNGISDENYFSIN